MKKKSVFLKKMSAMVLAGIVSCMMLSAPAQGASEELEGSIVEDGNEAGESAGDPVEADISQDDSIQADITDGSEGDGTDGKTAEAEILSGDSADDHVVVQENDKPYLALGANLTDEQRKIVLELLGVDASRLEDYDTVTVTNEEEHKYLDAYLDASTIGTRALSSVVIIKREKGSGIRISTKNISYCTVGMYKNALMTAGLKDADVIVAGPFPISGTAALIGAMKAYADMENSSVDTDSLDAAMNEIVVTGALGDSLGDNGQSEEFIAYLKQKIVENGLKDPESIREMLNEACEKFDVTLNEDEKEEIVSLMKKIGSLDLDVDNLKKQAGKLYESIASLDTDNEVASGIGAFLKGLLDAIVSFFTGLFS